MKMRPSPPTISLVMVLLALVLATPISSALSRNGASTSRQPVNSSALSLQPATYAKSLSNPNATSCQAGTEFLFILNKVDSTPPPTVQITFADSDTQQVIDVPI